MYRHQNAGQNRSLLFADKSFENVVKYQLLGNNSKVKKGKVVPVLN
jgi:hypothetical protein